jgi:hypothetical protein
VLRDCSDFVVNDLGDTEIPKISSVPRVKKDIRRLHIAMHDAAGMDVV